MQRDRSVLRVTCPGNSPPLVGIHEIQGFDEEVQHLSPFIYS